MVGKKIRLLLSSIILMGGILISSVISHAAYNSIDDVSNALISQGKTMASYVEGVNALRNDTGNTRWQFGKVYDSTGKRVLTNGKDYNYNRITNTPNFPRVNDDCGDVIFNGAYSGYIKQNLTDNRAYALSNTAQPGYHFYQKVLEPGMQIPLAGWKIGLPYNAVHGEGFNPDEYPVGADLGLINPSQYGRWAMYHGVEFHSVNSRVTTFENEPKTICQKSISPIEFYRNSTTWHPICAACGELISRVNIYASIEAISSLPVLEAGIEFVCTCPTCGGMETQHWYNHTCRASSANSYTVNYAIGTTDSTAYGVTASGAWLYNFATEYEGKTISTQDRTIAGCGFVYPGYTFAGWKAPDGTVYQPGASLRGLQQKLSSLDNGTSITLTATWIKNKSKVQIDANTNVYNGGAKYNGVAVWTSGDMDYKSTYTIDTNKITLPTGYKVSFSTNGGSAVSPINAPVSFAGTRFMTSNANGFYNPSTRTYTFGPIGGTTETIRLEYKQNAITLPNCTKSGASFIGWYSDASFSNYVGSAGSAYNPNANITLYARFETLDVKVSEAYFKSNSSSANSFSNISKNAAGKALNSAYNPGSAYAINYATGASHLSMKMFAPNSYKTIYKPYYRKVGSTNWIGLQNSETNPPATNAYDKSFTDSGNYTYTVKSSGFYQINCYGAQGGNYGSYTGGGGGQAYATFYLREGEILYITNGGQNGYNGGGTGSVYGNGGGYTIVTSNINGTLLVAGGGGGAGINGNGYGGGDTSSLRGDGVHNGANGQTGGGGGYVGGNAGEYIVHTCTEACYRKWQETQAAEISFYAAGTASTTNTGAHENHLKYGNKYVVAQMIPCETENGTLTLNTGKLVTAGSGVLRFRVANDGSSYDYTRNHGEKYHEKFMVSVYDKDTNAILYQIDATKAEHTENTTIETVCENSDCGHEEHRRTGTTWIYNNPHATGTRFFTPTIGFQYHNGEYGGKNGSDHYVMNFEIPIPESTNGVYIQCFLEVSPSQTVAPACISNVTYIQNRQEQICGYEDGQIISSKPGYGGSSTINTAVCQYGTGNFINGIKTGNGATYITGVSIGMVDGATNNVELLAIPTKDTTAPSSVGNLTAVNNGSTRTISWNAAASNATNYEFLVQMYEVPTSGSSIIERQSVSGLRTEIESAIAGYYYICDNNASTNVANYVKSKNPNPNYVWDGYYYSDATVKFTTSTLTTVDNNYSYIHVAAVDVAGNIGPTSTNKFDFKTGESLCKITFDTNHLQYQLNPAGTVSIGTCNAVGKTSNLTATGKNKEGYFYQIYYSVNGTNIANTGKGTFDGNSYNISFSGAFPIPNAEGCTFIGWNSKADGSGTFYSHDGSNIGISNKTDKVLILKDITGDGLYGQTMTLYAIWSEEYGNDEQNVTYSISKTYNENNLNNNNNKPEINETSKNTSSSSNAIWTNKTLVITKAKFKATGVYAMSQHLFTISGNRVATLNYYMGGANNIAQECILNRIVNKSDGYGEPIWIENDEKITEFIANGSKDIISNSKYSNKEQTLIVDYNVQGSYTVYGSAISRSYLSNIGIQGLPAFTKTDKLTLKIDKTIPSFSSFEIEKPSIENLSDLNTVFTVNVSDCNDEKNGAFYDKNDASGISKVYLVITNFNNSNDRKIYEMSINKTSSTTYDNHILTATCIKKINLFTEFPNASAYRYEIIAVDNAGNISKSTDNVLLPGDEYKEEKDEEIEGVEDKFEYKVFIYNDENDIFNVSDSEVYFQTGSKGHIEVLVIGGSDSVQLNFKEMGLFAENEIKAGRLDASYNMGTLNSGYTRVIPASKSTVIAKTDEGIPYIQRYEIQGFGNNGMSFIIPPEYQMTPTGEYNKDGTPQYYWETHSFEVIVKNGDAEGVVSGNYILWGPKDANVHYRPRVDE